jgi:hypothetical protein
MQHQLPPSTEWIVDALHRIDRRLTALERARAKPTIWPHPEFWTVPAIMIVGIITVICITVFR